VSGACTRRFHGLLIAAHPAPLGRLMMLTHVGDEAHCADGHAFSMSGEERPEGDLDLRTSEVLEEFRLEGGLPVWRYRHGHTVLEKRIVVPNLQNSVHVSWRVIESPDRVRLRVRPSMHFRSHEGRVDAPIEEPYLFVARGERYEICGPEEDLPTLR